jgi:hypothetical protein
VRGARPGGALDRWSCRCPRGPGGTTGEPGRVLPQHTRGVSASRLCSGESTLSRPDSFGCSAPMRETDSAREAVLESLVELNPTGSFAPPSVGALTWRGLTGPCPSGVGCPVRVRAPEIP